VAPILIFPDSGIIAVQGVGLTKKMFSVFLGYSAGVFMAERRGMRTDGIR
jgi:hypothetical protein